MGLFTKSSPSKTSPNRSAMTIVAQGTSLLGDIKLEGKLHIDGTVEGNIRSEHSVTVGRSGTVKGTILAETVMVSGHVDGDIECEALSIENTGTVDGRVCSEQMTIAEKGNFIGQREKREEKALSGQLMDDRDEEEEQRPSISATSLDDDDSNEPKVSMASS